MRVMGMVLLLAGCGASPNQPMLANAPRPNQAAVAGVAAGAAAAITLADPDAASRRPEKKQDTNMKPMKVTENVSGDVLDRLDKGGTEASTNASVAKPNAEPAGSQTSGAAPKSALDFGAP